MRKEIFIFIIISLINTTLFAQMPGKFAGQNFNVGHFYGKIVDATSSKSLEAVSIQLLQNKFDTVTKQKKDIIVAGMLTNKKGEFSLENLPVIAQYKLLITALGYKNITQNVQFDLNKDAIKNGDYSSLANSIDKDLGNIKLQTDVQQLQGVTVVATKPLVTMSIDKKVYNVEKDLNSAGGTAVDVMKNVPSVSVDLDGNVSMRNAPPQIFVDGRPTTLSLDQIPADAISSVEIITNPSAKYDAGGGGAGILNIVLKKNRKAGYNGNVRLGVDSRARSNFGGDINIKQQKINFFASAQVMNRKSISSISTNRIDYLSNATAYLNQNDGPITNGAFAFFRGGMDYLLDNRNTVSLSGNITNGHFKATDLINIKRDTAYTTTYSNWDYGNRTSNSIRNFTNYGGTVSFKHNFAKPNKDITADMNYNNIPRTLNSDYATQYYYPTQLPKGNLLNERNLSGGTNKIFTSQIDYESPISSTTKIEAGARIATKNYSSYNDNYIKDNVTNNYISLPILNSQYAFKDRVLAAYGTFSQQIKKFSYQVGTRIESSKYTGILVNTNQSFSNKFPFSIFPSAFLTYKLDSKNEFQLNCSRKINRPNFFQLIPYIDFTDPLNLIKGNPNLTPEFTTLFELSYQTQLAQGHSLLGTAYFKNTNNLITRNQYKVVNPNGIIGDSVIMSSYINANKSYTYGLEFTLKDRITKWWDITTNVNFFNSTIDASNINYGNTNSQGSWFGKMNNSLKFPKKYSLQITADYFSKALLPQNNNNARNGGFGVQPVASSQGYLNPTYEIEAAIRKDFLKNNAASLTLQFNDIFRTKVANSHSESKYFVQNNFRRQDPQLIRLNFNWRFGKMDANLFKRKSVKGDSENMQSLQNASGQ